MLDLRFLFESLQEPNEMGAVLSTYTDEETESHAHVNHTANEDQNSRVNDSSVKHEALFSNTSSTASNYKK